MRYHRMKWFVLLSFSVLLFTACESESEEPEEEGFVEPEAMLFEVDESLSPSIEALGERRLVGLVDEVGVQLDLVAEELIFVGDEGLEEFLDRWDATLVETTDLSELDSDLPVLHQVVVEPSQGDADRLTELFEQYDEVLAGDFTATEEDALGLLAIAMEEKVVHGNEVMINPYFPSQGDEMAYVDETLQAAQDGDEDLIEIGVDEDPDDVEYDRNPSSWVHFQSGSTQDIGVTDAWRALALAGLTEPDRRIHLLVLDGGFVDVDLPASHSSVFGQRNVGSCGGNPCPWHGIAVTQVAIGDPLSGEGAIGTGGPVGGASMVGIPSDFWSIVRHLLLLENLAAGIPDIVNMSFGENIHWGFDKTFRLSDLLSGIFLVYRNVSNILSFAAAGNDGMYLHHKTCPRFAFGACWERHKYLPCQASGVFCVGGLDDDSRRHHGRSNFGRAVDLWAPFKNYTSVKANEENPDMSKRYLYAGTGTSYSSPYVAGVAALVMAADRSLSAKDVRDILLETARDGEGRAHRYIQAREAVYRALGGAPFRMSFVHPQQGGVTIEQGQGVLPRVHFQGGDFPATLQWRLNGQIIGQGTTVSIEPEDTRQLEVGTHELSITATAGPYELTRTRQIEVVHSSPSVTIQSPLEGQVYYESSTIPLFASSTDRGSVGGELEDSQITWTDESGGNVLATGHRAFIAGSNLGVGTRTVVVTADNGHATASQEVTITVDEDPDVVPPDAVIISPTDGQTLSGAQLCCENQDGHLYGYEVDFEGQAFHGGSELSGGDLVWRTRVDKNGDGNQTTRVIGQGSSFTAILYHDNENCSDSVVHHIELTATGPDGVSRTVEIEVYILTAIC